MPIITIVCIAVGSALAGALPVTLCVAKTLWRKTNRLDSERARLLSRDLDEGVEAPEIYAREATFDDEETVDGSICCSSESTEAVDREIRPGLVLRLVNNENAPTQGLTIGPTQGCLNLSISSDKPDFTNFSRIASVLAEECKLQLPGIVRDSPANRMVVRKWMADRLSSAPSIRRKHKSRILPLATALVFVPTIYEIEVERIEATDEVVRRREDYNARYWSYEKPSAANWFGRLVSHQRSTER